MCTRHTQASVRFSIPPVFTSDMSLSLCLCFRLHYALCSLFSNTFHHVFWQKQEALCTIWEEGHEVEEPQPYFLSSWEGRVSVAWQLWTGKWTALDPSLTPPFDVSPRLVIMLSETEISFMVGGRSYLIESWSLIIMNWQCFTVLIQVTLLSCLTGAAYTAL